MDTGCEYGDKDVAGCAGLIKSQLDSRHCYGTNSKVCCRTCAQYLNASNIGKNLWSKLALNTEYLNCLSLSLSVWN